MKRSWMTALILTALGASPLAARAAVVTVSFALEDEIIAVGQTTTLHVFAQVTDGAVADNGLYAYGLNVPMAPAGVVLMTEVEQLGNPDFVFSDAGTMGPGGLLNIYGGDGDFFFDPTRGIGAPFDLFTIDLFGASQGVVEFSAEPASIAAQLGLPAGFLLQAPGAVSADYSGTISLTVIPEPASVALLVFGAGTLAVRRLSRRP